MAKMGRPRVDSPLRNVTIRLGHDVMERLSQEAEALSQVIRAAIEEHLSRMEQ